MRDTYIARIQKLESESNRLKWQIKDLYELLKAFSNLLDQLEANFKEARENGETL